MRRQVHPPDDPEYGIAEIVWPPEVLQAARSSKLLYLDLNHWIGLARAQKTSSPGAYSELLATLRAATRDGRVQVVLSAALFREIGKIMDPAQRAALTQLIDELSGFAYLAGLPDILKLEIQAVLDARTHTRGLCYLPVEIVGYSALHAMGMVGGLRIVRNGVDVTAELGTEDLSFQELLTDMERLAEQMLLAGPSDEEIPNLRASGYRPEIPQQSIRDNAAFEEDWGKRAATYRATHHLRDLVIARHLSLELLEPLSRDLEARGLQIEHIVQSREQGRLFVMSMPSSVVIVSLTAQYHQDPNKVWTQNDIYDIDALAVAVPYCDIVFTDAAARDALLRRDLDVVLNTALPRRPEELTAVLNALLTQ